MRGAAGFSGFSPSGMRCHFGETDMALSGNRFSYSGSRQPCGFGRLRACSVHLAFLAARLLIVLAGAFIAAVPTLVVYLVSGKYFVRGLMAGSVKG